MDQPYSFWADWLSKFHTASDPIQALWILALTAVALAALHALKSIAVAALRRRTPPIPNPVATLARDPTGRLVLVPALPDRSGEAGRALVGRAVREGEEVG